MTNSIPPVPEKPGQANASPTPRNWPVWLIYLASMLGGIYLLNPGLGVFELLPDNLPLVGNLDEAGAMMLVWWGIQEYLKRRKSP
jgi:hypothetical protein